MATDQSDCWIAISHPGFLPRIFLRTGKIYSYANFYCHANISIVFGQNFREGEESLRGQTASGVICKKVINCRMSQDFRIGRIFI